MICHEGHTFKPGHWIKVVKCMELGLWNESVTIDCVDKSNNLFQDWTAMKYNNLYSRVQLRIIVAFIIDFQKLNSSHALT